MKSGDLSPLHFGKIWVNRHELGKAKDQCWDNDEVIMYTHLLINVKTEFQHEMRTIHSAAMWIVTTSALGKN